MKKTLASILILWFVLFPNTVFADTIFTATNSAAGGNSVGYNGQYNRQANYFILDSDCSITGAEATMKVGGGSGTVDVLFQIHTDSSNHPSDTLADANAQCTVASFSDATYVSKSCSMTSWDATASTKYWLVLRTDETSTAKYYRNNLDGTTGTPSIDNQYNYRQMPGSWTSYGAGFPGPMKFNIYGTCAAGGAIPVYNDAIIFE